MRPPVFVFISLFYCFILLPMYAPPARRVVAAFNYGSPLMPSRATILPRRSGLRSRTPGHLRGGELCVCGAAARVRTTESAPPGDPFFAGPMRYSRLWEAVSAFRMSVRISGDRAHTRNRVVIRIHRRSWDFDLSAHAPNGQPYPRRGLLPVFQACQPQRASSSACPVDRWARARTASHRSEDPVGCIDTTSIPFYVRATIHN